jgi:hypothetical protein
VTGLFANSAEASGNCEAKLVDKSYDCSFTDNTVPPSKNCAEFFTGGSSKFFDLNYAAFDWGCACDAKAVPIRRCSTVLRAPLSAQTP